MKWSSLKKLKKAGTGVVRGNVSTARHPYRVFSRERQWLSLLLVGFLLGLVVLGGNMYLFYKLEQDDIFMNETVNGRFDDPVTQEEIEAAVRFFDDRRNALETLKEEQPLSVDPAATVR